MVGSEEKCYKLVRNVISELDFLYENTITMKQYQKICPGLKEEILNKENQKVYIIDLGKKDLNRKYQLIKYIRENDYHNEIILVKDNEAILDSSWNNLHNIFDILNLSSKEHIKLKNDLELIFKHMGEQKCFNYQNRDMNLSIYLENILYIYRDTEERKVVIVTDNNLYSINMGLKDVFYLLDERFKQVHRACLVNTQRTQKFDWSHNSFILDNGISINLLSKHYKENIESKEVF